MPRGSSRRMMMSCRTKRASFRPSRSRTKKIPQLPPGKKTLPLPEAKKMLLHLQPYRRPSPWGRCRSARGRLARRSPGCIRDAADPILSFHGPNPSVRQYSSGPTVCGWSSTSPCRSKSKRLCLTTRRDGRLRSERPKWSASTAVSRCYCRCLSVCLSVLWKRGPIGGFPQERSFRQPGVPSPFRVTGRRTGVAV